MVKFRFFLYWYLKVAHISTHYRSVGTLATMTRTKTIGSDISARVDQTESDQKAKQSNSKTNKQGVTHLIQHITHAFHTSCSSYLLAVSGEESEQDYLIFKAEG